MPDAYVPVIKLTAQGIDIDLTYAQLPLNEVARNIDVQNNGLLRGMDEASVRSINGCRVTDKILLLVQERSRDCTAFRTALRFLKVRTAILPGLAFAPRARALTGLHRVLHGPLLCQGACLTCSGGT